MKNGIYTKKETDILNKMKNQQIEESYLLERSTGRVFLIV